ncbi:MAG: hypothetical protein ACK58T_20845, partial [Phycisphaerae bacterium]
GLYPRTFAGDVCCVGSDSRGWADFDAEADRAEGICIIFPGFRQTWSLHLDCCDRIGSLDDDFCLDE